MDEWRARLKEALAKKGLDMKKASLGADLNAAAVAQIVSGKDPQASTLIKLATAHGISLDEVLLNSVPVLSTPSTGEPRFARVVGACAAGLWFDASDPPQVVADPVPYVPTRYLHLEQTAYRVVGPSMNLRKIDDGDYVIVVPYWQVRDALQDNDLVVVEKTRDGGLVERTIKEVVVRDRTVELTPRSSDARYQEPIVVPRRFNPRDYQEVEVVGLVIGRYAPLAA
jgi:SOS-response transcriptional repressor LexA